MFCHSCHLILYFFSLLESGSVWPSREPSYPLCWVRPATPGVCPDGVPYRVSIVGRGRFASKTLCLVQRAYGSGKSAKFYLEMLSCSSLSTWSSPWDFWREWRFWSTRISPWRTTTSRQFGELELSVQSVDFLVSKSFRSTRGCLARCLQSQLDYVSLAESTAKHMWTGTRSTRCHHLCTCREKVHSFQRQSSKSIQAIYAQHSLTLYRSGWISIAKILPLKPLPPSRMQRWNWRIHSALIIQISLRTVRIPGAGLNLISCNRRAVCARCRKKKKSLLECQWPAQDTYF